MTFQTTNDADATLTATTPATVGATTTARWLRYDFLFSSNSVAAYYSADETTDPTAVTWTQVGTTTVVATTMRALTTSAVQIGGNAGTGLYCGLSRYTIIKDGATFLDINPATETLGQTGWTCTTGQALTVARATSGYATAVVTRPLLALDGSDDYLQLPAEDIPTFTATTGTNTVLVVARNGALAASGTLWSSESASNVGANLFLTSAGVVTARVGGATTTADATVGTAHDDGVTLNAFALVYSTGTVRAYRYGATISATTDTTGVGTVTHASAPRVGSRADSGAVLNRAEVVAVVQYGRALTQTELDTASAYLVGSYT
jgi:hypothetical protein